TNLAATRTDKLDELSALLDAHHAGSVGPLYAHKIESPIAIDKVTFEKSEEGDEFIIWPN
ncbi:MAG: sulfatase, partial [Henriciella sp.]|nr:sulfatase [Henriciella sp.]